jgi:hypothetical protein
MVALKYNYRIDITLMDSIGTYTFEIIGGKSVTLEVKNYPYQKYAKSVLRALKVQRSGSNDAMDHEISHLGDSSCYVYKKDITDSLKWNTDNTQKVNMVGGWYDAGDYIKVTLTTSYTSYLLLRSYEL